jgi:type IV pilus assembly protein PilQ
MQDIVTNMRGTRAFDKTAGRVMTLALAATAVGIIAPTHAASFIPSHSQHRSIWAVRWDKAHPAQAAAYHRSHLYRVHRVASAQYRTRSRAKTMYVAAVVPTRPRVLVADFPATHYVPTAIVRTATEIAPTPRPAQVLTETGTPANVTLDFVSADISDVLKALSLQTHTNIVSGPDVKGAITVSLANVSLDQALNMISHISGFQYAKIGNTYAVGSSVSMASLTTGDITTAINFFYSDQASLMAAIKAAYPDIRVSLVNTGSDAEQHHVHPDSSSNNSQDSTQIDKEIERGGVLVVTGSADQIQKIRSFVDTTENGFVIPSGPPPINAVIEFDYSDPTQLTQIITDRYPNVKVTLGKAVGTGGKAVLVVTGIQSDVAAVRQLVADTEQGLGHDVASSSLYVYQIRYADASDLVQILDRFVPDLIVTPGASQRKAPVAPSTADAGGTTSTTTAYGASSGATTTVVSETGNMPTKPTTDTLLLSGSPADIARAQQILAQVDTRPAQINFEAKVTDLDVTLARDLGLGYSFAGAQTTIGQVTSSGAAPSTNQFTHSLPFGYTPLSQFVNVQLYADQNKGDARILASPNISAIDGQPAAIFIGNNVTYVSSITSSTTGENVTTATISAGIKLYITGKVDDDGYVTVNLHPEVSTYTLTPAAGGASLPNVSTREATTTLRVRDGDYIALGGLAENNESKTANEVPLLSDIPVLGNLFRYDTKAREQRELVIFIRVSIQKDPTDPSTHS